MATAEALQKMETRAVAAEKLIVILKTQIAEVKLHQVNGAAKSDSAEVEQLRLENLKMKQEIDAWKLKLTQAEIRNGKVTVAHPIVKNMTSDTNTGAPVSEDSSQAQAAGKSKQNTEKKEKKKKEKSEDSSAAKKANTEPEAPIDVGRLDLRVGRIISAKKHPDADSLYVEEVDVGEEKNRTVISGLVKFIPIDEMQDRMAVLLCNLKPSKMRGIMSEAMVMCASTPEKVEILSPPAGCKPGDPVLVEGFNRNPDGQLNPKKKIFETCAPDLTVNESKEACFKNVKWTVNGMPVTSQSLANVQVK